MIFLPLPHAMLSPHVGIDVNNSLDDSGFQRDAEIDIAGNMQYMHEAHMGALQDSSRSITTQEGVSLV